MGLISKYTGSALYFGSIKYMPYIYRGADPGGAGGASAPPGIKGVVHSISFAPPGNREASLHELRSLEINFAKKIILKYFLKYIKCCDYQLFTQIER